MEKELRFISALMIAVSNCSLYSREHEAFDELAKRAFTALSEVLDEKLALMILDNELIINTTPVRHSTIHKMSMIKRLKKKKISRVDFLKGIQLSEVKQFIFELARPDHTIGTYPHITSGNVDVNIGENTRGKALYHDMSDHIEQIKDIFHMATPQGTLNVTGLEEMVGYFIVSMKSEASILKLLQPFNSHDEYTYTHAVNVAVLSLFQAETLGLSEDMLHEIGIAALVHDAGKLFISKEILQKKGKLDDHEFNEIKKHPWFGARYLAKMNNMTRLAPLVAFEHHMKYDGTGYPAFTNKKWQQHIVSQITTISDFFDALRSTRSYRAEMDVREIIVLMHKGSGRDFNPYLVDNFIRSFQGAIAA